MATAVVDHFTPFTFTNDRTFSGGRKYAHSDQLQNGSVVAKHLIGEALRQRVESIDHESCDPGDEDTFFVGDLGEVYRQHMRWKKNLPRVKPFYGTSAYNP
jgi:ornithine decarboxylase